MYSVISKALANSLHRLTSRLRPASNSRPSSHLTPYINCWFLCILTGHQDLKERCGLRRKRKGLRPRTIRNSKNGTNLLSPYPGHPNSKWIDRPWEEYFFSAAASCPIASGVISVCFCFLCGDPLSSRLCFSANHNELSYYSEKQGEVIAKSQLLMKVSFCDIP